MSISEIKVYLHNVVIYGETSKKRKQELQKIDGEGWVYYICLGFHDCL